MKLPLNHKVAAIFMSRVVPLISVLSAVLLLATATLAQPCQLQIDGLITDSDTKEVLPKATITVLTIQKKVVANYRGYFTVNKLCPGTYRLVITHAGCDTVVQTITITQNTTLNIALPHARNNLEAVTVATQAGNKNNSISQEIKGRELALRRGLTLAETIEQLPGVTVLQTGSTIVKPVIHGLHGNRILILNNGVRQEGQQWGSEHAPEVDAFLAQKITVLKGAGALQYGADAIGGAILVDPKALPAVNGLKTELSTAYFTNNRLGAVSVIVENALRQMPQWAWRVQATARYGGNVRTPNYWLHNTGVQEWNASATLGHKGKRSNTEIFASIFNTSLGIFWGSQVGSLADLQAAINRKEPLFNINQFSYTLDRPKQQVQHLLFKAKYTYNLTVNDQLQVLVSHQENKRQEFDLARITDAPELDLKIGTTLIDANYEAKRSRWQWQPGLQLMIQNNVWSGSRFFIPNFESSNAAAYFIGKHNTTHIDAEVGIRYDARQLTSFRNNNGNIRSITENWQGASASAGVTFKISPAFQWLLNGATAWRAPGVNELYVNGLHHGTSSFEIGDANLQAERAYNFSTQLKYKLADSALLVDVTLYNNLIDGFINLVPDTPATLTIRGAFPTFRYRQTNARLTGADISLFFKWSKHLHSNIKSSWLWAFDRTNSTWLAQMPSNRWYADLAYHLPQGKYLSNNLIRIHTQTVLQQRNLPRNNTDYLLPPPTYTLFGVELATQLGWGKQRIQCSISATNMLNTVFRDYMDRFRYFNDGMGRNIAFRMQYSF